MVRKPPQTTGNSTQSDDGRLPTLQARLAAIPPISDEPLKVSPNGQHIRRPKFHPFHTAKIRHNARDQVVVPIARLGIPISYWPPFQTVVDSIIEFITGCLIVENNSSDPYSIAYAGFRGTYCHMFVVDEYEKYTKSKYSSVTSSSLPDHNEGFPISQIRPWAESQGVSALLRTITSKMLRTNVRGNQRTDEPMLVYEMELRLASTIRSYFGSA